METSKQTPAANFYKNAIGTLSTFFKTLSTRLELLGEVAAVNLYTLILLVIMYLFYWTFPQAKDLLLTINQESHPQIALFFTSLVTLAGICWYMPRYFYAENRVICRDTPTLKELFTYDMKKHQMDYEDENEPTHDPDDAEALENKFKERYFKEMIPRALSTALLLLVTLGIWNVGNEMNLKWPEGLWEISAYSVFTILATVLLLILLVGSRATLLRFNLWIKESLGNKVFIYFGLVALVLGVLMFTKKGGEDDLLYLLLASFLISVSFLVFTICRKQIPFFNRDRNIRYLLGIMAAGLSLSFILINVMPYLAQQMNPLVCANLAFVFYLTLFYLIRLWGVRTKVLAVLFLLAGIAVVASFTSSTRHHEVSYLPNRHDPTQRLAAEDYFKAWVIKREGAIKSHLDTHPNDSFPVIIVSAEGGGSRAAFWTSLVHGYLEQSDSNYYKDHLFALTGASGGSTGNCTFFAMKQGGVAPEEMAQISREMFEENYLSSSLTMLMGADLGKDILGLPVGRNRAKQLESEWSYKMDSLLGKDRENAFKKPFLEFWYDNNTKLRDTVGPLLFINTTQVQGAGHAIVSPVKMKETTYRGIDLLDALYEIDPTKTIPLVAANLLNASFPYINPAGQISGIGSFVDAGYFDNYGARTGAALLKELSAIRARPVSEPRDTIYKKLKFISVLIRNSTVNADPSAPPAPTPPSNQLLAPVSTIGNIRSAVNDHNLWDLEKSADDFFLIDLKKVPVEPRPGAKEVEPIIPLARYLSPLAVDAMVASLDSMRNQPSELKRLVGVLE